MRYGIHKSEMDGQTEGQPVATTVAGAEAEKKAGVHGFHMSVAFEPVCKSECVCVCDCPVIIIITIKGISPT